MVEGVNFEKILKDWADTLRDIKVIFCDIDGVMTTGGIQMINVAGHMGELMAFSGHDGIATRMARLAGLKVCWITGRGNEIVFARAKRLWVNAVVTECMEKDKAAERLLSEFDLHWSEACAIGDDIIDVPMVEKAGFGVAVKNASIELKEVANYVTVNEGGRGAVREVIELILRAKNAWEESFESLKAISSKTESFYWIEQPEFLKGR